MGHPLPDAFCHRYRKPDWLHMDMASMENIMVITATADMDTGIDMALMDMAAEKATERNMGPETRTDIEVCNENF